MSKSELEVKCHQIVIFFFIFYLSKAKISKLHRYIALSTKIDNSWSILSPRSKVKVKWSLNIKHSTSRNFLDIWQRNFKDSSKCPSWLEEHFVYWQLFSIFNRYGDISKRRPPPLHSLKVVCNYTGNIMCPVN